MEAATQVVYASDGTPYYAGQGLVNNSCAAGTCHSMFAERDSRKGAPYGLNFDLAPLTRRAVEANFSALHDGLAQVHHSANDMWGAIADGAMPPGKAGQRPDEEWKNADGAAAGLPGLSTDVGKVTVRNWLACGAPVISGMTGAPKDANRLGEIVAPLKLSSNGGGATFDTVFDIVFRSCGQSCHMPGGVAVGLDLSTKDAAYASLVDKAAFSGDGAGKCGAVANKLIEPSHCTESLVYQKLHPNPPCGEQMPPTGPLSDAALQMLCNWIDAGAKM
jgi:hypothetical protein